MYNCALNICVLLHTPVSQLSAVAVQLGVCGRISVSTVMEVPTVNNPGHCTSQQTSPPLRELVLYAKGRKGFMLTGERN
jgi:hypothetical protein